MARNLFGATPADAVSPISARKRPLIVRATSRAGPSRRWVPVTSTKASSTEIGSSNGEYSDRRVMISPEARVYLSMSTGRKTASGQRRAARPIGMAEWTPNRRAS